MARFGAVVTRKIAFEASANEADPTVKLTAPPTSVYAAEPASKRMIASSGLMVKPTPGAGTRVTAVVCSASSCALESVTSATCKPAHGPGPTANDGPKYVPAGVLPVMGF